MKSLLLTLLFYFSLVASFAQQRDTVRQQIDDNRTYDIDAAVVVKQRFVKARGFTKDDNGKILENVIVTHGNGKKQRKTVSDKDGYFTLDSIKSGNPLIRFTKTGYISLLYKINPYEIENIQLAFDPNSVHAEYDFGYFKETQQTSTQRMKVTQGETLRRYSAGGKISNILPSLLGFSMSDLGAVVLNSMRINKSKGESYATIIDSINPRDIAAVAYMPSYSGSTLLFGMGSMEGSGVLVIKLK